jgi:hypothetical protein
MQQGIALIEPFLNLWIFRGDGKMRLTNAGDFPGFWRGPLSNDSPWKEWPCR